MVQICLIFNSFGQTKFHGMYERARAIVYVRAYERTIEWKRKSECVCSVEYRENEWNTAKERIE